MTREPAATLKTLSPRLNLPNQQLEDMTLKERIEELSRQNEIKIKKIKGDHQKQSFINPNASYRNDNLTHYL